MKTKVYIETTIPSYLASRPSDNVVAASRQLLSQSWWTTKRGLYHCVTSDLVLLEASKGDPVLAEKRVSYLKELPLLSLTKESEKLASLLLQEGIFPPNANTDAQHLAIATIGHVDILLSWNFRHLVNAAVMHKLKAFGSSQSLSIPAILSPESLFYT